ncbi:hypothetical protein T484DRAFT_1756144 [Baffinella frigidus]|nr:hypothetical protein T484DRAFT_1756144 [Cryptophyta sp. CCMP2293]
MMQFPETWNSQTRPLDPDSSTCKRKRRTKPKTNVATEETVVPAAAETMAPAPTQSHHEEPQVKRICLDIESQHDAPISSTTESLLKQKIEYQKTQIQNDAKEYGFKPVEVLVTSESDAPPVVLDIHSLISRLPYSQMLNQVFTDDANSSVVVPVVTLAFEESFMREVIHTHERSCVCGDNCECNFIDPQMPFVGVEFTLGGDASAMDAGSQMCILCSRRLTQELFYNMVFNGHRFRGIIQRYGSLCNQPGEYAREAMLICPQNGLMHNMPLPMVSHQRHRYSVYSQNGIRYLRQHHVKVSEGEGVHIDLHDTPHTPDSVFTSDGSTSNSPTRHSHNTSNSPTRHLHNTSNSPTRHSDDTSNPPTRNSDDPDRKSTPPTDQDPTHTHDDVHNKFCTTDTGVNDILTNLHMRLKRGYRSVQREIDTYLMLCACEKTLSGRDLYDLQVAVTDVPHYDTLPDLTRYIPFSFTMTREPGIIAYYIQLLSPLKRKTRTRRGSPSPPLCPIEACVCLNIIQASLLGLYPRSSKHPLWRTRVAIAACIHQLQTSSFDTQKRFLALSHDLLRMSFTEYIMNVRTDFCPVENEFLTRQAPFLPNYDTACATLCDHVRQTCVQSNEWSWAHINSVCAASLDRISRMCRTRVISANTPNVFPSFLPEQLQAAIHAHVVYPDPNTHNCVTPTNCVEQALHTRMLPWNMVRAQAARIAAKYSDQLFPITSVCEKHICIKCVLAVNVKSMLKISKLRMQTSTSKLTCANCNSDDTVLCVNVLGKLLNIRNTAYFGCQECAALHEYNPVHPLMCTRQPIGTSLPLFDPHNMRRSWTGGVEAHGAMAITTAEQKRRAEDNIIVEATQAVSRDRKHRCKWCGRVCSARSMMLLHQPSASIVSMTLCFKHMPPHHMMGMIKDTNALIRYIMASNESKT